MELRSQFRQPITWFYILLLPVLAYLFVMGNYIYDAREGYFLLNAPILVATVTVLSIVHWLLIGGAVAGNAATRDVQARMHLLTYTTPVRKASYLGGRFLAAFLLNLLILAGLLVGLLVALQFSGVEADILGPFRLASYASSFCFLLLPDAFIATAIQFSLATLTRSAMASYLAGVLLFVAAYLFGLAMPDAGAWVHLADPMCFTSVMNDLSNWGPVDRNTKLLQLEGPIVTNRLLWIAVSLALLAITYVRFRFALPGTKKKTHAVKPAPLVLPTQATQPMYFSTTSPRVTNSFGWQTQIRQLRMVAWKAFLPVAKSLAGIPLLALLALVAAAALPGNLAEKAVAVLPRTDFVLHTLVAPLTDLKIFWILIWLLVIYYAGEMVWRERESGIADLVNTTAVPGWIMFLGKYIALNLLLLVWLIFLMIAGMLAQAALGGVSIDFGLYLHVLFGLQLADCLLFSLLVLLVHVLVNQKYVGHLLALLVYGSIVFAGQLGLEHKLLIFSASPQWTYTNMAGYAHSLLPFYWFKGYWLAWALLLAVLAVLCWVRGRDTSLLQRFRLARSRFTRRLAFIALAAVIAILATGSVIFYNTNLLHPYKTSADFAEQRAAYEQQYRKYLSAPQPVLAGVKLQVEIYPSQRAVIIQGTYLLVNHHSKAIDSIHIATAEGVETTAISFDRPAKQVLLDKKLNHGIYALGQPLLPGDSLRLRFRVNYKAAGFSNNGAAAMVLENGTSIRNFDWLPAIGYQPYRELDEAGSRKAHGLHPRPATPSLYDSAAYRYAPFSEQVSFEAIIGTNKDQQVVAPGSLQRTWTKAGRQYFHYATDVPIRNEYNIFSARYAVEKGSWRSPLEGSNKAVAIEVYYPPGSGENPKRMVKSIQASLDYYSRQFGAYPHQQIRFIAHPGYAFGNHASPINITTEEGFFLLNPKKDPQGFDFVTAVVAHEVAHQWFGNLLRPAQVEGAGLLTESLAWYAAMGVLEVKYGEEQLGLLLDFLRDAYETPRSRAAQPLLQANDWYQNYRKGPLAFYSLSQYMGRERVNNALRQMLAKHRPGSLPLATSLDLYDELQAVTPDTLQGLLHDLFKANVFWDLETRSATAKPLKSGGWEISLTINAKKTVVDSAGIETVLPMQDWVEVAAFAAAEPGQERGRQLYGQKHLIKPGQQNIRFVLQDKPATVGIDPRHLLIDWNGNDNFKTVQ